MHDGRLEHHVHHHDHWRAGAVDDHVEHLDIHLHHHDDSAATGRLDHVDDQHVDLQHDDDLDCLCNDDLEHDSLGGPGPPASSTATSTELSAGEPEEEQPAARVQDTGDVAPTEDIPPEVMTFEDVSFDKGGNWSGDDLSWVGGDAGSDLLGGKSVGGETASGETASGEMASGDMASGEMTAYEFQGEPKLAEDHRPAQGPAPAAPASRVVGGVLIAGALVVMVVGASRRRSTPALPRRP